MWQKSGSNCLKAFFCYPSSISECNPFINVHAQRGVQYLVGDKSAIFYSTENAHAYKSGPRGWRPFCFGRDEFDYWPLAVSMPPTKVSPQCKATVSVRWKTCELCDETYESSRIRVWNQLRKLNISCTRPVKECQKFVSELCIGRNKTMRMASMRVSRDSIVSAQVRSHALMHRGFGTSVPFIMNANVRGWL